MHPRLINSILFEAALFVLQKDAFHVALHDHNDEGNFKWCKDNNSLPLKQDKLLKFASGEPSNLLSDNCAVIQGVDDVLQLNDVSCNATFNFICEVRKGIWIIKH